MDPERRKALEAAGYRFGDAGEFLDLNPIERLRVDLAARFPGLEMEMEVPPNDPGGVWSLEIRLGAKDHSVVLQWWPEKGFGVSLSRRFDYGTGPDEIRRQASAAFDQVVHWVLTRRSTDERGRILPLTEEQARRRAEEALRALDDVAAMGDEEEQRATLDALMQALNEEPLSDRVRFRT